MDSDSTFQGTCPDPVPGGSMASATVDVHGTVVAWSLGARWLFGYLPSEAVGRPITEVFGLSVSRHRSTSRRIPRRGSAR